MNIVHRHCRRGLGGRESCHARTAAQRGSLALCSSKRRPVYPPQHKCTLRRRRLARSCTRAKALGKLGGWIWQIGGSTFGQRLEDAQPREAFRNATTYLSPFLRRPSPAPTLETRRHFISRWKSLKIDRNFTVNEAYGSSTMWIAIQIARNPCLSN